MNATSSSWCGSNRQQSSTNEIASHFLPVSNDMSSKHLLLLRYVRRCTHTFFSASPSSTTSWAELHGCGDSAYDPDDGDAAGADRGADHGGRREGSGCADDEDGMMWAPEESRQEWIDLRSGSTDSSTTPNHVRRLPSPSSGTIHRSVNPTHAVGFSGGVDRISSSRAVRGGPIVLLAKGQHRLEVTSTELQNVTVDESRGRISRGAHASLSPHSIGGAGDAGEVGETAPAAGAAEIDELLEADETEAEAGAAAG